MTREKTMSEGLRKTVQVKTLYIRELNSAVRMRIEAAKLNLAPLDNRFYRLTGAMDNAVKDVNKLLGYKAVT